MLAFRGAIEVPLSFFLPGGDSENFEDLPGQLRFALPVIGGLAIGLVLARLPAENRSVGVVHVMERLSRHQGHLSLIAKARDAGADAIVVSIFVNPLQFGPKEDFATYPRTIDVDRRELERMNVDVVFIPGVDEM